MYSEGYDGMANMDLCPTLEDHIRALSKQVPIPVTNAQAINCLKQVRGFLIEFPLNFGRNTDFRSLILGLQAGRDVFT